MKSIFVCDVRGKSETGADVLIVLILALIMNIDNFILSFIYLKMIYLTSFLS